MRNLVGKEKTSYGISFLEENGSQIRDSAQIAEIFNTHFSDLAKSLPDANLSSFDPSTVTAFVRKFKHSDCKLNFPPITPEQTQQIIESIPSSKTTGADELSVRLLKIAAPSIASSLTKLINLCIDKLTFPSLWKQARVVPLHKCGSKSDKTTIVRYQCYLFYQKYLNDTYSMLCTTFSRLITCFITSSPDLEDTIPPKLHSSQL